MSHSGRLRILLVVLPVAISLSACSGWVNKVAPNKREMEYQSTAVVKPLEIPPDLSTPNMDNSMAVPELPASGTATYSSYAQRQPTTQTAAAAGTGTVPSQDNIQFHHQGTESWLTLKGSKETLWPKIREFWIQNGFILVKDDPKLGILETDWAENRANIPLGMIRSVLGKVADGLYDSGLRDKYRVRLEQGSEPGTTELFITHRGAEEIVQGSDSTYEGSKWQERPSDPGLEAEMLKRMMVYLGLTEKQAGQVLVENKPAPEKTQLSTNDKGQYQLVLDQEFSRAWRLVGIALDRIGFSVEDRDRSKGIYYIRYNDPDKGKKKEGWLSKLAFWSSDSKEAQDMYQLQVIAENDHSRLVVNNKDGQPDKSTTSERILKLLQEQLK